MHLLVQYKITDSQSRSGVGFPSFGAIANHTFK